MSSSSALGETIPLVRGNFVFTKPRDDVVEIGAAEVMARGSFEGRSAEGATCRTRGKAADMEVRSLDIHMKMKKAVEGKAGGCERCFSVLVLRSSSDGGGTLSFLVSSLQRSLGVQDEEAIIIRYDFLMFSINRAGKKAGGNEDFLLLFIDCSSPLPDGSALFEISSIDLSGSSAPLLPGDSALAGTNISVATGGEVCTGQLVLKMC